MPDKMPKSTKRLHVVAFRLSDDEFAKLEEAARRLTRRRTRGDLARAIVCKWAHAKVPEPIQPRRLPPRRMPKADIGLLAKLMGELGKIGSNVNQLARAYNRYHRLPELEKLEAIAADLEAMKAALEQALHGDRNDHQGE
ncbi:plasmid mobilization relaxosome protein MobC [Magnetospirillum sp. SS-4]|uniref:plasmid mobilization relaxosome protein MobC n=1 Tax=Magnetospirillum sp. SS-4 TaxID=2681465 RepID=UPI001381AC3A|nr:plasmid mobilization relaxosome protein MobC [Magnetospirillum sp. SS-4]CAA7619039.1 conserved hypothetical protein [Magnetospirillum sp. SS-4]